MNPTHAYTQPVACELKSSRRAPCQMVNDTTVLPSSQKWFVQGSTNRRATGLVNFVPALAYHFCLNLLAAFTKPGAHLLVESCTWLREISSCSCLPVLAGPAWVLLSKDLDLGEGRGRDRRRDREGLI